MNYDEGGAVEAGVPPERSVNYELPALIYDILTSLRNLSSMRRSITKMVNEPLFATRRSTPTLKMCKLLCYERI